MNNPNQKLYVIYRNIQSFYGYRKLVSLDDELDQEAFIQKIQRDKYLLLSAADRSAVGDPEKLAAARKLIGSLNEKSDTRDITVTHILLIYPGTECESKRINMMKLINHVRFPTAKVIIVTPTKISTSVAKGLLALVDKSEHRGHEFKAFTYTLFNCVLPRHELVPQYEILSPEQLLALSKHFVAPDALPKIFEHDPQMVWIGAAAGDVVKYTYLSEVTIEAIGYAKVVPAA